MKWLPLPPWSPPRRADLAHDAVAAVAALFVAVPAGLAYATIAGLPPAAGLYASAIPTVVGALFRSSRHVLAGPTNAVSLLVGAAVLRPIGADPMSIALTLALMVGLFQTAAGLLRLGTLVDYVSSSVVLGYITGAGVLIGAGQLYNVTGTRGPRGRLHETLLGWFATVGHADWLALTVALSTVAAVIVLRRLKRALPFRLPTPIVVMTAALLSVVALDLDARGLRVIADLAPIQRGLPRPSLPSFRGFAELLPVAIAISVLSLIESSAVARSIAARTGQRLDASTDFFGQGLSNLAASVFGGYPVSGSLSRSALNERAGAKSRWAGVLTGCFMIGVLLLVGPMLDRTPIAALAGLLLVVAYDLVDVKKIRQTVRASPGDALAFVATLLGTWLLSLDVAIYLGVGLSLVLHLRQARLLVARDLVVHEDGLLVERSLGTMTGACTRVRILHVEGRLFFAAAGELQTLLDEALRADSLRVLIVRLKRAPGLDASTAAVFASAAEAARLNGKSLLLAGMGPGAMRVLERSEAARAIGAENLFPAQNRWFAALDAARQRALGLAGGPCEQCPLVSSRFLAKATDVAETFQHVPTSENHDQGCRSA